MFSDIYVIPPIYIVFEFWKALGENCATGWKYDRIAGMMEDLSGMDTCGFTIFDSMGKTMHNFNERKLEAIQWLAALDDDAVLEQIRNILSGTGAIWWDEQSDLEDIAAADAEIAQGKYSSQAAVMRRVKQKYSKA
jgi:hypothetical protein